MQFLHLKKKGEKKNTKRHKEAVAHKGSRTRGTTTSMLPSYLLFEEKKKSSEPKKQARKSVLFSHWQSGKLFLLCYFLSLPNPKADAS